MTKWSELVFLAEEISRKLKTSDSLSKSLPQPTTASYGLVSTSPGLPASPSVEVWLLSGPDDYDTLDETIYSIGESKYRYSPDVLWALSVTNNAASGGPNLLLRFTTTYGRVKQYKIAAGKTINVNDIKGGYGSEFRVITDSGSVEMIALVSLKHPLA